MATLSGYFRLLTFNRRTWTFSPFRPCSCSLLFDLVGLVLAESLYRSRPGFVIYPTGIPSLTPRGPALFFRDSLSLVLLSSSSLSFFHFTIDLRGCELQNPTSSFLLLSSTSPCLSATIDLTLARPNRSADLLHCLCSRSSYSLTHTHTLFYFFLFLRLPPVLWICICVSVHPSPRSYSLVLLLCFALHRRRRYMKKSGVNIAKSRNKSIGTEKTINHLFC